MTAPDFAFRPQLAEDVARYVRKRIFDGTYAAGQYIRLDQLATELGVSVTPVREALFVLSAEGLLSQQPRRGFVVVSPTSSCESWRRSRPNWKMPTPAMTMTGRSGSTTNSTRRSMSPPTRQSLLS